MVYVLPAEGGGMENIEKNERIASCIIQSVESK